MKTIKVYSGNGMSASLAELLPQFERQHDCKVDVTYAPAQVMLREVKAGRTADLGLIGSGVMDQVLQLGLIVPASVRTLTRNGIGVGVLAGASKPDLSSVESFKRVLLNARCVAYTTEGASGIYFAGLIEKLGIAEPIKAKAKTRSGGLIAEFVLSGDADIAVQQIPEIMAVAGVDYAGPLPAEIQSITVGRAGVFTDAKESQLTQALLDFLQSPAAARVFKARGLEPADG
jgi:molybdate transport system substrate-binding protein